MGPAAATKMAEADIPESTNMLALMGVLPATLPGPHDAPAISATHGRRSGQIEPVVELRFWASDRGYPTLILECERMPNGTVLVGCPATGQQYVVERAGEGTFRIDRPFYGLGDSERCVEIPWALSRFHGERRVLDLGHANAEPRYTEARNALAIPFLARLDPAAVAQNGICGVAGDAMRPPFRKTLSISF